MVSPLSTYGEINTKFKLNWWPTSNTIKTEEQGKTEEVEKNERKIDLIISGTGRIIAENKNEEDRVGHDNLSCETKQNMKKLQRHNPLITTCPKLQQTIQLKENIFRKK